MQVFNKLIASALFVSVLMLAATVGRAGVTVNTTVPYDGSFVFIPCANDGAGEMAEFTGPLHILMTFTVDANGGIHGKFHFQPMGLIAIGEDTGDVYRATGESQGTFNTKVGSVTTFINNFKIIGPGTGNNLLEHENLIVVIDAGGNVIVDVDHITTDCK